MKSVSKRLGGLIAMIFLVSIQSVPVATHAISHQDPVIEWNMIMRTTVAPIVGFMPTRTAAMMHLAIFEAVNAIVKDYEPYLGTLEAPANASPKAAAIAAAHHTLRSLHPENGTSLDASLDASLSAIPDGTAKVHGIAVGEEAADAILAIRVNDRAAVANLQMYVPGSEPGDWQLTPPGFVRNFFVGWGNVATFGIKDGAQFNPKPPPSIDSNKYARHYNEVKEFGSVNSTVRTQAQTDRARFYSVNLPTYVFNETASQVSVAEGKTLSENARIFALLNMSIADGLISSMASKYYYDYWRPVTAIQAGDTDGNSRTKADPNWMPLIITPPYPAYASNYASAARSAQEVLEEVFRDNGQSITLVSANSSVDITLHYTRFSDITDDASNARIHGGIHYRFDTDAGKRMGQRIGSYIVREHLRPDHGNYNRP